MLMHVVVVGWCPRATLRCPIHYRSVIFAYYFLRERASTEDSIENRTEMRLALLLGTLCKAVFWKFGRVMSKYLISLKICTPSDTPLGNQTWVRFVRNVKLTIFLKSSPSDQIWHFVHIFQTATSQPIFTSQQKRHLYRIKVSSSPQAGKKTITTNQVIMAFHRRRRRPARRSLKIENLHLVLTATPTTYTNPAQLAAAHWLSWFNLITHSGARLELSPPSIEIFTRLLFY